MGLVTLGCFIGALAEPPGRYVYYTYATGGQITLDGFGGNMAAIARFLVGVGFPLLAFALARLDRRQVRQVLGAFVAGGSLSAMASLVLPHSYGRAQGLAGFPTHLGTLSLYCIGGAVALLLGRRGVRPIPVVAIPILLLGVIESGSRASLGAVMIFFVLVGPLTRLRSVMGGAILAVVVVGAVFAFGGVRVEGENAIGRTLNPGSVSAQYSDNARSTLQHELIARWKQVPFTGTGLSYMRASHNVYLGVLASGGVLAVLGLIALIAVLIRRVIATRHDVMTMALTSAYLAYLVGAWFDNVFFLSWQWFFTAMVMVVAATARPADPPVSDQAAAVGPIDAALSAQQTGAEA
jgi:O-antigen ligase